MDKFEFIVVYWSHCSRRYECVGLQSEELAKEHARRIESYGSKAKVIKMPGRAEMNEVTDNTLPEKRFVWS